MSERVNNQNQSTEGNSLDRLVRRAQATAGPSDPDTLRSIGSPQAPREEPADEASTEKKPPRKPSKIERYIRQVLSGSILTQESVRKHYPYMLFMVLLMFLYIANGFHVQKLHRRHDQLSAQVKELRAKSLTIASQRMMATRQSTILEELQNREIPLEELLAPPQVIDK